MFALTALSSRYLLQGPDGFYCTDLTRQAGISCTKDPAQADAFVDVDVAAAKAKALIANGVVVQRITPVLLPRH